MNDGRMCDPDQDPALDAIAQCIDASRTDDAIARALFELVIDLRIVRQMVTKDVLHVQGVYE